jgi:hypothetical protein
VWNCSVLNIYTVGFHDIRILPAVFARANGVDDYSINSRTVWVTASFEFISGFPPKVFSLPVEMNLFGDRARNGIIKD